VVIVLVVLAVYALALGIPFVPFALAFAQALAGPRLVEVAGAGSKLSTSFTNEGFCHRLVHRRPNETVELQPTSRAWAEPSSARKVKVGPVTPLASCEEKAKCARCG